MSKVLYVASECFGPQHDGWRKFIEWSGLTQLKEVVGLDSSLCASVIGSLVDEDWSYNDHPDQFYFGDFFTDLNYLLRRQKTTTGIQILAVLKEPTVEPFAHFEDEQFDFCGYELIEDETRTSALTNCGGFPESFNNAELSDLGLLTKLDRAKTIQKLLKTNNPEEPHADCSLWAIWRMRDNNKLFRTATPPKN